MKKILIFLVIISATFIVTSNFTFATQPPKETLLIDQAVWSKTTKDKAFDACLAAVAMAGFAVNPLGTKKDIGLIMTNEISFQRRHVRWSGYSDIICKYTLQIVVTEIKDNKVMINLNALNTNYDWEEYNPGETEVRSFFDNKIALDFQEFFAHLENLLGKAESYRKK